jgi:hypothetical protein
MSRASIARDWLETLALLITVLASCYIMGVAVFATLPGKKVNRSDIVTLPRRAAPLSMGGFIVAYSPTASPHSTAQRAV